MLSYTIQVYIYIYKLLSYNTDFNNSYWNYEGFIYFVFTYTLTICACTLFHVKTMWARQIKLYIERYCKWTSKVLLTHWPEWRRISRLQAEMHLHLLSNTFLTNVIFHNSWCFIYLMTFMYACRLHLFSMSDPYFLRIIYSRPNDESKCLLEWVKIFQGSWCQLCAKCLIG